MRDFPYYQQPIMSRSCGTACLCMIYDYFGIQYDFGEINQFISVNNSCRTHRMVLDLLRHGLTACCITCNDLIETIKYCRSVGIEVIVLAHLTPVPFEGHFCVVSDVDDTAVYLNNPLPGIPTGKNERISQNDLTALAQWRGQLDEIGAGNTVILVKNTGQPVHSGLPVYGDQIPFFPQVLPYCTNVLNPYVDRWIEADQFISAASAAANAGHDVCMLIHRRIEQSGN